MGQALCQIATEVSPQEFFHRTEPVLLNKLLAVAEIVIALACRFEKITGHE
jgi:hypothetical protein